ncbi:unnamed protein product [Durusdinium trenchii]|uniref:Uncharacterized protein n=1 Tax=Durusdinium trenchii TaxID=1381693 RepID=A0ABP0HY80_9DINO
MFATFRFARRGWEECHQRALQLYSDAGVPAWALDELKTGLLEAYAQSAVLFYDPADPSAPAAEPSSSSGYSVSDAPAVGVIFPPPSVAVYCKSPLRSEGANVDVHVISFSSSFLDLSHPENQDFLPMSAEKWKVVTRKIQWLCGTIFSCASQRRLDQVSWDLTSAGAAAESDDAAALRQVVKATVKEMEYLFQVDLAAPSTLKDAIEGASYSLLVTSDGSGDPCGLRECSALPLLCSPSINPHLSQVPVEALKINEPKKWKPSAPVEADLLGTSGAVPVPPQADLLEVQAVPAVNPVDVSKEQLPPVQPAQAAQAETSDLLGNLTTDNLPSTIGSAPPVSVPNGGVGCLGRWHPSAMSWIGWTTCRVPPCWTRRHRTRDQQASLGETRLPRQTSMSFGTP